MIEVEKKFLLSEKNVIDLQKDAVFLSEKVFTDTYYDTVDYSLTTKDAWLRSRDGKFELKVALLDGDLRLADQYEEIEDEQKIREYLRLKDKGNLLDDLEKNGYSIFCRCRTTRKKYRKEKFVLDFDIVEYDDFDYKIAEIELMVENKSQIPKAIQDIMELAGGYNLKMASVRGKVIEYLLRKKKDHYQVLKQAGVIRD